MAKPLRVLANLPKNPFECVFSSRDFGEANRRAREEEEKGKQVKVTSQRAGPRGLRGWRVHNVWTRDPATKS